MLFACNNHLPNHTQADYSGLIITEVAANADKLLADSWVEIHNTSSREIDLTGLGLFLYDEEYNGEEITIMDNQKARPGERLVFSTDKMTLLKGISSQADFELVLARSSDKKHVDKFSRKENGKSLTTP